MLTFNILNWINLQWTNFRNKMLRSMLQRSIFSIKRVSKWNKSCRQKGRRNRHRNTDRTRAPLVVTMGLAEKQTRVAHTTKKKTPRTLRTTTKKAVMRRTMTTTIRTMTISSIGGANRRGVAPKRRPRRRPRPPELLVSPVEVKPRPAATRRRLLPLLHSVLQLLKRSSNNTSDLFITSSFSTIQICCIL